MLQIVTDYLDRTAARWPDRTAYVSPKRSVSFCQLRREAQLIAGGLIRLGLFHKPVVIFTEKSIETIAGIYGVVYSGNFYTVMDTEMPAMRIQKIMDTLCPAAFLTTASLKEEAERTAGTVPVLVIEELTAGDPDEEKLAERRSRILPTDLMYVLFTSGSTGVPKGVATSHFALVSYIDMAWEKVYKLNDQDVFLNQVPFYFVMSSLDVFAPAAFGATTHIVPAEYYSFPAMLVKYIEEHHVTVLNWVPSAMSILVVFEAFDLADVSSVNKVLFGGEVVPMKVIREWRRRLPNALFINGYGSTETTDACLYYQVDRDYEDGATMPAGRPYPNMDVFLLDEEDRLVTEIGEIGEICARSPSLSYGYYRDRESTEKVFVPNPLTPAYEEKIYRTGDLGRWNEERYIEFAGRKDFQIKHMGHRIELGEIESNVSAVEGVDEAACIFDKEKNHILLYYTGRIEEKELGSVLKETLPAYMLPHRRKKLEQMPHNLNGKIDRKSLSGK